MAASGSSGTRSTRTVWRNLGTIAGGEVISADRTERCRVDHPAIAASTIKARPALLGGRASNSRRGYMMRTGASLVVLAALILSTCWGCGSDASPYVGTTVPVKGKVTYKGKPLTQGQIVFEPDNSGREAHGSIQPDGTFELSTFTTGRWSRPRYAPGCRDVRQESASTSYPSSTRTPAPRRPRSRSPRGSPSTLSTSSDFRRDRRRTYQARGRV